MMLDLCVLSGLISRKGDLTLETESRQQANSKRCLGVKKKNYLLVELPCKGLSLDVSVISDLVGG